MARKRTPRKFEAVKAVKAASREHIGALPRPQVVPNRKTKLAGKAAKHKKTLEELRAED
jgi:hypothetical protein